MRLVQKFLSFLLGDTNTLWRQLSTQHKCLNLGKLNSSHTTVGVYEYVFFSKWEIVMEGYGQGYIRPYGENLINNIKGFVELFKRFPERLHLSVPQFLPWAFLEIMSCPT